MYTMYLPAIGEVVLHFATIRFDGFKIYISGYDEDHNRVDFTLDRLIYPENSPEDCGYCHIVSYNTKGQTVPYSSYHSIH